MDEENDGPLSSPLYWSLPPPIASYCVSVGGTKSFYSFAVAASPFGLCHIPSSMISGAHWPALARLAILPGHFRPTLDGSSLVMPAWRPLCLVTSSRHASLIGSLTQSSLINVNSLFFVLGSISVLSPWAQGLSPGRALKKKMMLVKSWMCPLL